MYLRVTAFRSDPAKLDAGVAFLRDKIIPAMKKVPGFVGATCVVNREKGEGAASTLWESLEAMNNAEQIGQQSRSQSSEGTGMEVIDVDRFEVTTLEMAPDGARLPRYTRTITAYGDPKRADQAAKVVRDEILPKLKTQPGFSAYAAGINRMTGRGFTISSWATPEQREKSRAAVASVRERVIETSSLYGEQVDLGETVLVDFKVPATAPGNR